MASAPTATMTLGADWSDVADGLDLLGEALTTLAYSMAQMGEGLKATSAELRAKSGAIA